MKQTYKMSWSYLIVLFLIPDLYLIHKGNEG